MTIGIEDFCEDIVGKAMRGTKMSDTDLAAVAAAERPCARRRAAACEPRTPGIERTTMRKSNQFHAHFGLLQAKLAI